MRILIAPDKFKGCLSAAEVAQHLAAALRAALPNAEGRLLPLADGGEGTASAICGAAGGEWHECDAHDPLDRLVRARYGIIESGSTAVIESSEASGLRRLALAERNPEIASSYGTGEMLLHAAGRGARKIIVGLGGSATNDGGFGLARALGYRFFTANGRELARAVSDLIRLETIETPRQRLRCRVIAAADVRSPLLGARGATVMFGAQKGATPEQMERLEVALGRLADVVARDFGKDFRGVAGAGAAGGLGFGLMSFCQAEMRNGFEVVAAAIGLEAAVREADVVITGEGRLDAQTLEGKAPAGVARLARKHGKKVCAIAGGSDGDARLAELFDAVVILARSPLTAEEAMKEAAPLIHARVRELAQSL